MKKIIGIVALVFWFLGTQHNLLAQETYKVHSHNDYEQELPFWYAYSNGAASIEADVFLKNGTLYVTHAENEIKESVGGCNVYERILTVFLMKHI